MKRPNIHQYPWEAQEYIQHLERKLQSMEEKQKNSLDLLNWAKSELKEETHPKLGKRMTAYRSDRIRFLRSAIEKLSK